MKWSVWRVSAGCAVVACCCLGEFLEQGRILVGRISPWTEPKLPPLASGQARLMVLTPSGPHFGQAAFSAMGSDPNARPVLEAAFQLLNAVLSASAQTPPTEPK